MKTDFLLVLPVAATMCNIIFVIFFCEPHKAAAQPIRHQDAGVLDRCIGLTGEECGVGDLFEKNTDDYSLPIVEEEDERDPMLQKMPGYDFDAYVRADVSTFYGEEPGARQEFKPTFEGQAGKFINMSPERVTLYWDPDNGEEPDHTASLGPWSSGGTACFPTHKFIITKKNRPDEVLCRFTITPGISVYYCDPFAPNEPQNPAKGEYTQEIRSIDELSEADREYYDAHAFNLEFGRHYKNFTGGSEWLSMYPRNPPRHKIWRAAYFGQEHYVTTKETQFTREPPADLMHTLSVQEMRESPDRAELRLSEYRAPGIMNITIKALSCAPRALEIRNFLSDVEVDHILDVVAKKHSLARSMTGKQESNTRTSRNTWVPRSTDPVLNAIIRRAADVLRLDEALLRNREEGERYDVETKTAINEDLQVVHYAVGQEYTAHHDFGYPKKGQVDHPERSINLCMYLNNVEAGGQTSFPRWRNGETSESFDVTPEKGKAVIFYMVNPDGNLDDLTQHAALPVIQSEKWFANLWLHDPFRL